MGQRRPGARGEHAAARAARRRAHGGRGSCQALPDAGERHRLARRARRRRWHDGAVGEDRTRAATSTASASGAVARRRRPCGRRSGRRGRRGAAGTRSPTPGEPCEWMWPPEASTVSPPAVPGPRPTSTTPAPGASASEHRGRGRQTRGPPTRGAAARRRPRGPGTRRPARRRPRPASPSSRRGRRPAPGRRTRAAPPSRRARARRPPATRRHSVRRRRPRAPRRAPSPGRCTAPSPPSTGRRACRPCTNRERQADRLHQRDACQAGRRAGAQRRLAAARAAVSGVHGPCPPAWSGLPYGRISQPNIMLWSSCARLWQCATYGPAEGPEPARDHDLLARVQRDHVLLAGVVRVARVGRGLAVARRSSGAPPCGGAWGAPSRRRRCGSATPRRSPS